MRKPEYTSLLSVPERLGAMKLGAVMALAEHGIRPSDMVKKSAPITLSPAGAMKAVGVISLLAGIPIGAAMHAINRRITSDQAREKELKEKIRFYREAGQALETGLAAPEAEQA